MRLGGRPLSGIPRREAARALGYLPQGFEPLFPILARDLVLLGRTPWRTAFGAPSARDRAAVEAALAEMDAGTLAETDLGAMSGGERQRVLSRASWPASPRSSSSTSRPRTSIRATDSS